MDAGYFLSDVTASNARVYATSAVLGGLFQTICTAHDLYQNSEYKDMSESGDKNEVEDGESKDEE